MSHNAFGEFSPHVIRSSGGPAINGITQYRARFFCAKYETFDFVFHSAYLVGIRAQDKLKLSDDITEDDFTSTPDSRIWDLSPMRSGAAKTARESAKSPADITPVSKVARMLAAMEAMTGLLYVGELIARLVGLYSTPDSTPKSHDS